MTSLARAAIAVATRRLIDRNVPAVEYLRQRGWGDDRTAALILRGPASPATTTQAGWAIELAQVAQMFLRTLTPMSAGAALLDLCLGLSFDRVAKITLPSITPGTASFVTEGAPIRVAQLPTAPGAALEPYKFASIVELSREMIEASNAEVLVRQALIDSTAPSLDAALFSTDAGAPGLRPPGLLAGLVPIAASSATTSKVDAMDDDVCALVGAIAALAGNSNIAIIAAPPQATRLALRAARLPFPLLSSSAIAAGTVIAVAVNGIVSAIEPVRLEASLTSLLHEEDSTPAEIVSVGGVVAVPQRSLWQTDSIALRMLMPLSWARRDAGAVSFVESVTW